MMGSKTSGHPAAIARHGRFRPTLLIYLSMGFWTVLFCLVMGGPFLWMRCFGSKRGCGRFFRRVIWWYGRLMIYVAVWPWVRVRVVNPEACRKRAAGIWVFNHRSGSDPFLMASLGFCDLVQAVNGWPMRLPFFGYFARLGGYLDITNMSYGAMEEEMRELFDSGVALVAFPEGTRSGSRRMNQFRSGVFKLARDSAVPVYACCIVGNENLPDRSFRFGCGTIRVAFLREFTRAEVTLTPNVFLLKKRVRETIARGMAELEGTGAGEP